MFIKFCYDLAQKMGKRNIILIRDDKDISYVSRQLNDTLPVFISDLARLENPCHSYWAGLRDIMNQVSYAVLFFFVPNLIGLGPQQKQEKLEVGKFQVTDLGLKVDQIGWVFSTSGASGLLMLLENHNHPDGKSVPNDFRVVAMINTFNEEDIIIPCIKQLVSEGIEVYLIDNHSTDSTYQLAKQLLGDGLIGIEKWPENNTADIFPLEELLKRKEDLALTINANWFIHTDADEIRESPWRDLNLREAIWKIDQLGYNAVDFSRINFMPIDNNYIPGTSFKDYFTYFEFDQNPGALKQIRSWKKQNTKVDLHKSGGHIVKFPDRKVFPYKLLVRHYPFRSQNHAITKIFLERKRRFDPDEKEKGWHSQYEGFNNGQVFLKSKTDLIKFSELFYPIYIIERLSGCGVIFQSIGDRLQETQLSSRYQQLSKQNIKLRVRLRHLRKQLQSFKMSVKSLENQLVKKDQEILFYSQSKSWKVTRPMRSLMEFLRKLIR